MQVQAVAARPEKILRKPAVVDRIGLSGTTRWRLVKAGRFPPPIQLSLNAIGWRESDVDNWIAARTTTAAATDQPPARRTR